MIFLYGIVLFTAFSCQKNKIEWQEIQVINSSNATCGCSLKVINEYLNLQLEVISSSNSLLSNSDSLTAIVINKDSGLCSLIVKHYHMLATSKICNCPAEIINSDLTGNKTIKIKISGKILESCLPITSISNNIYSDFLLTKMYKER